MNISDWISIIIYFGKVPTIFWLKKDRYSMIIIDFIQCWVSYYKAQRRMSQKQISHRLREIGQGSI